jgi:type II secretory pathway component GspD/PulD (secretin)
MKRTILLVAWLLALGAVGVCEAQELTGAEFAAPNEVETHLIRVLRTTNKAQTNRYVPKVYDLNNVNPYDTIRFIRRSMEIEEGAWFLYGKPEDPEQPHRSVKSGKAVVVAPLYQIPYLDDLMRVIDVPGLTSSAGDELYYYRLKHRNAGDASFVGLVNAVLTPNSSTGNQIADTEVNGFLFYDSPSGIEDIKRWLPALDYPPPQVMLEATLYEVNVENDDALGLDFVSWKNGPGRELFAGALFWEKDSVPTLSSGADPLFDLGTGTHSLPGEQWKSKGSYYSHFLDVPCEFFDFLVTKQKARVLASAKLLTRNGRAAELEASDQIFYWRVSEDNDIPTFPLSEGQDVLDLFTNRIVVGDRVDRELGAESAGVFLDVTPLVGTEGINLEIELDIVGHTGFASNGEPQLVRRDFDTEMRVQDGQEVILGGYTREMMVQQSNKIPVLGSLPVLGWLFGGEQNLVKKRRVVVVLRATTIADFAAMTAAGSEIDAALIRARASGEWPVTNLKTEAGFDQWLLDPEVAE